MSHDKQLHFRASERDRRALREAADEEGTNVATLLRRIVRKYVRSRESGEDAPRVDRLGRDSTGGGNRPTVLPGDAAPKQDGARDSAGIGRDKK